MSGHGGAPFLVYGVKAHDKIVGTRIRFDEDGAHLYPEIEAGAEAATWRYPDGCIRIDRKGGGEEPSTHWIENPEAHP